MEDSLTNQYAALKREIDAKEEELEVLKDRYHKMEREVLEHFERNATTSVKGPAGTVYMHRQTWTSILPGTPVETIRSAFALLGWEGMLKDAVCSPQSLSAAVRQLEAEEKPLPPEVQAIIKTTEVFQARVRKS